VAFEARLARDPVLAAGRDAQRRIDRGLRGLFVIPPFVGLPINGHPPGGTAHPANGHPLTPAAPAGASHAGGWAALKSTLLSAKGLAIIGLVAAALLGAGGWLTYLRFFADRQLSFDEVYSQQVRATAADASIGRDQVESFASATLGYTVRTKKAPANVKLVSMTQAHVMSARTVVVHARVDGQNLLLLADHACHDVQASGGGSCELHRFRREVGGVVLYELTPLDKPVLLNLYDVLPPPSCHTADPAATQPAIDPEF
jgi:hypothetical protein